MGRPAPARDPADLLRVIRGAIDEAMLNAHLLQGAVHDQPADGAPSLGAGMRPEQDGLARQGEVADGRHQVRRPDPGARRTGSRSRPRRPSSSHPGLRALPPCSRSPAGVPSARCPRRCSACRDCVDDLLVDEGRSLGSLKAILVHAIDDETSRGLDHCNLRTVW